MIPVSLPVISRRIRVWSWVFMILLGLGGASGAQSHDLDAGRQQPATRTTAARSVDTIQCAAPFFFGGDTDIYTSSNRFRGNIYTFSVADTLTEITFDLGITASTDLWFYVARSISFDGPYSIVHENQEPVIADGRAFYSSGGIGVPMIPGWYYLIGVAWPSPELDYYREPSPLPRRWQLGSVEALFQESGSTLPLPNPISVSTYDYAEYSMTLCVENGIFHDDFELGTPSAWSVTLY